MGIELLVVVVVALAGGSVGAKWSIGRRVDPRVPRCECAHPCFEHEKRHGPCKHPDCKCDTYAHCFGADPALPDPIVGELMPPAPPC